MEAQAQMAAVAFTGFEQRAGGLYHPDACSACDSRTHAFTERLQATAVSIARQDGIETVGVAHVTRAYETLVAPKRRRRLVGVVSSAFIGLSGGQFLNVVYDLSKASGAPQMGTLILLVLSAVVAALAIGVTIWNER